MSNGKPKPACEYNHNDEVTLPNGAKGIVVGTEWAPDNDLLKVRATGWLYYVKVEGIDEATKVSEEDLKQCQLS